MRLFPWPPLSSSNASLSSSGSRRATWGSRPGVLPVTLRVTTSPAFPAKTKRVSFQIFRVTARPGLSSTGGLGGAEADLVVDGCWDRVEGPATGAGGD